MSVLLGEYLAHIRAAGYANRTIEDREDLLLRLDKLLPYGIDQAVKPELIGFLGNPTWQPQTRETYFDHIVGFYRWARNEEYLDFDPSDGIVRPKVPRRVPRVAEDETVTELLARAEEPHLTRIILAAFAGLRCCEIAALDTSDITEERIIAHGKGNQTRIVDTHEFVWRHIQTLILPPGPVTRNRHGQPATAREVSQETWMYMRRTLQLATSMHRLRGWFATAAMEAGADVAMLMQLMGHAHAQTTMGYLLVRNGRRRQAVSAIKVPA